MRIDGRCPACHASVAVETLHQRPVVIDLVCPSCGADISYVSNGSDHGFVLFTAPNAPTSPAPPLPPH